MCLNFLHSIEELSFIYILFQLDLDRKIYHMLYPLIDSTPFTKRNPLLKP